MKSFLKVVVPIAILMGVVGFGAFLTQNTSNDLASNNKPVNADTEPAKGEPLTFDVDPLATEQAAIEVEYMAHAHKDYWCHTKQERDVKLSLISKSCTCSDVLLGRFDIPAAEWDALAARDLTLNDWCRLATAVKFDKVGMAGEERLTVAATPAGKSPRPYILRVTWQAKKTPQEMKEQGGISVKIAAQTEGTTAQSVITKDNPYNVVPAVGVFPFDVDLGEVGVGSSQRAEIIIWSPTRLKLRPKLRLASSIRNDQPEPCAEFTTPVPFSPEELEGLPASLGPDFAKINPRCAYRFSLILHERRGEHQLDIGPLGRMMVISFETMAGEQIIEDVKVPVLGSVRGDVMVQGGDDRGRVSLGVWRTSRLAWKEVYLLTQDSKLELDPNVVTSTPKIKASLGNREKTAEGYRWPLRIESPPNSFQGELKIDIPAPIVFVQTKGPNVRRIRIPIHGTAENVK